MTTVDRISPNEAFCTEIEFLNYDNMAKIGGYASWYWQLIQDECVCVCVCDVNVIESGL